MYNLNGIYKLAKLRYKTPKTLKYRKRFSWFEWHIMIKDVPNFDGIYIHVGNDATDTRGCILVGNEQVANTFKDGFISNSIVTYKKLYHKIYDRLDLEECTIELHDQKGLGHLKKIYNEPS